MPVPAGISRGSVKANATPAPGNALARTNQRSPSPRPQKTSVYPPMASAAHGAADPLTSSSPVPSGEKMVAISGPGAGRQKNPPYPAPSPRPLVAGLPRTTSRSSGAVSVYATSSTQASARSPAGRAASSRSSVSSTSPAGPHQLNRCTSRSSSRATHSSCRIRPWSSRQT
jgi:hypothetical protein